MLSLMPPKCAEVVVDGATVGNVLTERTIMIILTIFASIAVISILCWLMFTLAVYALPVSLGVSAGMLAHDSGTGTLSAILIGLMTAGLTLFVMQFLLLVLSSTWLRLIVLTAFVMPAAIAGYCATYGIVQHFVAPPFWQTAISLIGGAAVCAAAFVRFTDMVAARVIGSDGHPDS